MKTYVITMLDKPNKNGRIYSTAAIEEAIKNQKKPHLMGVIGMPENTFIDLSEVSHTVTNLRIERGELLGDVEIMKTVRGKMLATIIDECEFRLAGFGEVGSDGVVRNFELISVNAVLKKNAA